MKSTHGTGVNVSSGLDNSRNRLHDRWNGPGVLRPRPRIYVIVEDEICVLGFVRSRSTPETGTWRHIRAVMAAFPPVCPTRKPVLEHPCIAFDFIHVCLKIVKLIALTMRVVLWNVCFSKWKNKILRIQNQWTCECLGVELIVVKNALKHFIINMKYCWKLLNEIKIYYFKSTNKIWD